MDEENIDRDTQASTQASKPMPAWVGRSSSLPSEDGPSDPHDASMKPIPNGISSSMSGPGIGDDVAMKRAHLMDPAARSDPQTGRRESPDPYNPWPQRWVYIRGMLLGALVIAIVFVILIVAGMMNPID